MPHPYGAPQKPVSAINVSAFSSKRDDAACRPLDSQQYTYSLYFGRIDPDADPVPPMDVPPESTPTDKSERAQNFSGLVRHYQLFVHSMHHAGDSFFQCCCLLLNTRPVDAR